MAKYHPIVQTIVELLTVEGCVFETFEHAPVRTSEEAAAVRTGYTLAQGAKALIVRVTYRDGTKEFTQVVVPGDSKFDPKKVRTVLHARDIRFATEEEVALITNDVLPGGVPPFGNLFGLAVVADESLFVHEKIIFNAGDRCFSIGMTARDYKRIVNPRITAIV